MTSLNAMAKTSKRNPEIAEATLNNYAPTSTRQGDDFDTIKVDTWRAPVDLHKQSRQYHAEGFA